MKLHGVYVICEDPLVVFGPEGKVREEVSRVMSARGSKVHYLSFLTWSRRFWSRVARERWRTWRDRGVMTHHVCNEPVEQRRFRAVGLRPVLANHNLMLDESTFKPMPDIAKRFDAVYTAHLWPYKRIGLARQVERLRIVTATEARWHDRLDEQGCGHAEINKRRFDRQEVAQALNESHCGLALSAEEGTMLAATEYLLCGLPVVSTPSIGGRDVWFDDYNSIIVEPTPEAVKAAVERLVAEPRDPQRIRQDTLARMQRFRQTLVDYVNDNIAGRQVVTVEELFGDGQGMAERFVDKAHLADLLAAEVVATGQISSGQRQA